MFVLVKVKDGIVEDVFTSDSSIETENEFYRYTGCYYNRHWNYEDNGYDLLEFDSSFSQTKIFEVDTNIGATEHPSLIHHNCMNCSSDQNIQPYQIFEDKLGIGYRCPNCNGTCNVTPKLEMLLCTLLDDFGNDPSKDIVQYVNAIEIKGTLEERMKINRIVMMLLTKRMM